MRFLNFTCPRPEENLALDEALLDEAERSDEPLELLRVWEPPEPMVVVGTSSRVADEVRQDVCRERGMGVFRRASGGAAIVTGPGCLMYAVVLSYRLRPQLRMLDVAHRTVMGTMATALARHVSDVKFQGTCDLTLDGKKFSGNSLRCRREALVYHGTLLYDFPLGLIHECLKSPPRQPEYRAGRSHETFVTNLPMSREELVTALVHAWGAREPLTDVPQATMEKLVTAKYSQSTWNLKY
jgi:lipoate-protein ligase A